MLIACVKRPISEIKREDPRVKPTPEEVAAIEEEARLLKLATQIHRGEADRPYIKAVQQQKDGLRFDIAIQGLIEINKKS